MKVNINSGDWKTDNGIMYYSQKNREWYCNECKKSFISPRTAGTHSDIHSISLPYARKEKIEVSLHVVKKLKIEENTKSSEPSIVKNEKIFNSDTNYRSIVQNVEKPHFTSKLEPKSALFRETDAKIRLAMMLRQLESLGVYSKEYIEELKIQYGFIIKPEPKPVDNSMILFLMMQNKQNYQQPSFSEQLWDGLCKAMYEKMKQEETIQ